MNNLDTSPNETEGRKSDDDMFDELMGELKYISSGLSELAAALRASNSEIRTLGIIIRNKMF